MTNPMLEFLGISQKPPKKKRKRRKRKKAPPKLFLDSPTDISRVKLQCDEALSAIIGCKEATRAQIMSKVWKYVKRRNLVSPKDRKTFLIDDKLAPIFGERGRKVNKRFRKGTWIDRHTKFVSPVYFNTSQDNK